MTNGDTVCVDTRVGIAILVIFVIVCIVSLAVTAYVCYRAQSDEIQVWICESKERHYNLQQSTRSEVATTATLPSRMAHRFGAGYYTPSSTPSRRMSMASHSPATQTGSDTDQQVILVLMPGERIQRHRCSQSSVHAPISSATSPISSYTERPAQRTHMTDDLDSTLSYLSFSSLL